MGNSVVWCNFLISMSPLVTHTCLWHCSQISPIVVKLQAIKIRRPKCSENEAEHPESEAKQPGSEAKQSGS